MLYRRISSAIFVIIICCFFLPFAAFSCNTKVPPPPPSSSSTPPPKSMEQSKKEPVKKMEPRITWIEYSGFEIMFLLIWEIPRVGIEKVEKIKIVLLYFFILSFICALICLVLSFRKKYNIPAITLLSAGGAILLLLWSTVWEKVLIGYYITVVLFIIATLLNAYYFWRGKNKEKRDNKLIFSAKS